MKMMSVAGADYSRPADDRSSRPSWLRPLYPAHRLDWKTSHAVIALASLRHRASPAVEASVESVWGTADATAFLSVRSALVALLESVNWPKGSEILMSGVNIGDIPKIIRSFGHVVIPVDIDPVTLSCDPAHLEAGINGNTRAILVAHLFGGRMDLRLLAEIARRNELMLIEDCAQSYTTRRSLEPRISDVRLFSFGLLKTGTVLGGAIAEVGDPGTRAGMREVQRRWARQPRRAYAAKIVRSLLFLALQHPLAYRFFARACAAAGTSSGAVLRKFTRGFGSLDGSELLDAFRRKPSAPLLRMLSWRLENEDGERVRRRALAGERLHRRLNGTPAKNFVIVGAAQSDRTHWLVPISTADPDGLRTALAGAGVDAYGASNVIAIGGSRATEMIDGLVFLPCYPEMSGRMRDRIADIVKSTTGSPQGM